jgi:hypothetical protein
VSKKPAHLAEEQMKLLVAGYEEYHALQVTEDRPDEQIFRDEPETHYVNLWTGPNGLMVQVLLDGFPHRPSNLTARYLADGNTITLDVETGVSDLFAAEYEYVDVPEGYYRPVSTVENHTVVLGMEPVQRELASDADQWPAAVSAIVNGTGTTTEELSETYLEHDGEVYQLRLRGNDVRETNPIKRLLPDWSVGPVRSLGYLGGFAALWYSGVAYGWRE